jgi:hypothetical protein
VSFCHRTAVCQAQQRLRAWIPQREQRVGSANDEQGVGGALGQLFLEDVGDRAGACLSVLGPINAHKSVVGLVLGIFLIGEVPTLLGAAGVLLILAGSYFVVERDLHQPRRHAFAAFFKLSLLPGGPYSEATLRLGDYGCRRRPDRPAGPQAVSTQLAEFVPGHVRYSRMV